MSIKKAVFIILLATLMVSCKRDKDNNNSLLFLLFYGLNQNVTFAGNFTTTNTSLNRSTKALPDGITDVIAISTANHYHRSKIDASGNFSIGLAKGYNYIFIFIDSANNVKGYYKVDSLSASSVPTHYAGNQINGGQIQKSSSTDSTNPYSPEKNFSLNDFLNQSGSTSIEFSTTVSLGEQLLNLQNIDVDGNGVIDLEEKLYTRFSFSGEFGGTNFTLDKAKNQFFDLSLVKAESSGILFEFTLDKSKVLDKTVNIKYPIPTGCNDTKGGVASKSFQDPALGMIPTLNDTSPFRWSYSINSAFTISCNNGSYPAVGGTYVFENSGKVYTFKNLKTFSIQSEKTIILPTVKINVTGTSISSLEYAFKKISPTGITEASTREVFLNYGNSRFNSGIFCADDSDSWIFNCSIPKENSSGTITTCPISSSRVPSVVGVDYSSIKKCYYWIYDAYGTRLGVMLNR